MPASQQCLVSLSSRTIIDDLLPSGLTRYGRKTLTEVLHEYPDATTMEYGEARKVIDDLHVTAPQEIDADTFMKTLEVLPPNDWQRNGNTESFKLCERLIGDISLICVRIGKRYFSFHDHSSKSHEASVKKARFCMSTGAEKAANH